ncbi:MAG: hypothetical protein RL757_147 [Bacteroidota bacterium]|jgi:hypothetical protein
MVDRKLKKMPHSLPSGGLGGDLYWGGAIFREINDLKIIFMKYEIKIFFKKRLQLSNYENLAREFVNKMVRG